MTTPIAPLQHLELAEEFYKAFRDLPQNGPSGIPVSWPRYFALCHATELALKAFMLAHGWSDQQLTRDVVFRHNISNLMAEAVKLGLKISEAARSDLDLLNEAHKNFWPALSEEDGRPRFFDRSIRGASCPAVKCRCARNSWRQASLGPILRGLLKFAVQPCQQMFVPFRHRNQSTRRRISSPAMPGSSPSPNTGTVRRDRRDPGALRQVTARQRTTRTAGARTDAKRPRNRTQDPRSR
jgi:hypothetical protein